MKSKILAAAIIVIILLVGIFLLAPNAFEGVVPKEYMPDSNTTISSAEIHWQNRTNSAANIAVETSDVVSEID